MQAYVERYRALWLDVFRWRSELSLIKKIGLALGMACLTGLVAQIRIHIPFSPVPITGQTFAVLAAGVMLGRNYGGLSQAIYAGVGFAGVPWFNGGSGGIGALTGPTGGYIIGFIFAALFVGYVTDKYVTARRFLPMLGVMMFANFVIIYGLGMLQLSVYMRVVTHARLGLLDVIKIGALPFVAGDVLKAVLAALMARSILPKERYDSR